MRRRIMPAMAPVNVTPWSRRDALGAIGAGVAGLAVSGFDLSSLDLVVARQGNDNRRSPDGTPFATTLIQKIVAAMR